MKLKNLLNSVVLGSALTITAAGCKSHPQGVTPLWGQRMPNMHDPSLDNGPGLNNNNNITTNGIPPTGADFSNYTPQPDILKADSVYFDYDKSAIKNSEQSKLQAVADYMKSHPEDAVRVEGNCDERGTEEYNRALGERRSLAAREYLVRLGVDANKVPTISYGNDKPVDPGHGESAWSQNRRDDFVVLVPPKP